MGNESSTASLNLPVIIGTAGHIDHGKSSLIKALTGTDPDRLKEEKERGITIELGFAFLNERIAFIDVPGHEHFIKHMVAGAATVDYALLVVAADDGVMPQTREHLDILNLLDVRGGLIAVTKADLADDGLAELACDEIAATCAGTVLDGAAIHVVDSLSGRGIPELRQALIEMAAGKRVRGGIGGFRMFIDRVFTMKGFGTVVTGSVLSGTAQIDDRMLLLPQGTEVRIRGIQSHTRATDRVVAGQRAALNLAGVSVEDVQRGNVLATPGTLGPTRRMLARVKMLSSSPTPLEDRQPLHLHIGTTDLVARVALLESAPIPPGGDGYVELRLESPASARRGDRFILRRFSPLATIGGGTVLDPTPAPGRRTRAVLRQAAASLDSTDDGVRVAAAFEQKPFATTTDVTAALADDVDRIAALVEDLTQAGDLFPVPTGAATRYCTIARAQTVLEAAARELGAFHQRNPLRSGMPRSELVSRLARLLPDGIGLPFLEQAVAQGLLSGPSPQTVAAPDFEVRLTRRQRDSIPVIEQALAAGALTPPSVDDLASEAGIPTKDARLLLTFLVDSGRAICLEGSLYFAMDAVQAARHRLVDLFAKQPEATTSCIRELLGSTRKFLIPMLQHFDELRWTLRREDVRLAGPHLRDDASTAGQAH